MIVGNQYFTCKSSNYACGKYKSTDNTHFIIPNEKGFVFIDRHHAKLI